MNTSKAFAVAVSAILATGCSTETYTAEELACGWETTEGVSGSAFADGAVLRAPANRCLVVEVSANERLLKGAANPSPCDADEGARCVELLPDEFASLLRELATDPGRDDRVTWAPIDADGTCPIQCPGQN